MQGKTTNPVAHDPAECEALFYQLGLQLKTVEQVAERRIVEWLREYRENLIMQQASFPQIEAGQLAIKQVADAIERGDHR